MPAPSSSMFHAKERKIDELYWEWPGYKVMYSYWGIYKAIISPFHVTCSAVWVQRLLQLSTGLAFHQLLMWGTSWGQHIFLFRLRDIDSYYHYKVHVIHNTNCNTHHTPYNLLFPSSLFQLWTLASYVSKFCHEPGADACGGGADPLREPDYK